MEPSVPLWPRSVSLFFLSVTTWDNNEISRMRQGEMEKEKKEVENESHREHRVT